MTPGCLRWQSGELFDFLNVRGRLHEGAARRFFQQLITGIEACHAAGAHVLRTVVAFVHDGSCSCPEAGAWLTAHLAEHHNALCQLVPKALQLL